MEFYVTIKKCDYVHSYQLWWSTAAALCRQYSLELWIKPQKSVLMCRSLDKRSQLRLMVFLLSGNRVKRPKATINWSYQQVLTRVCVADAWNDVFLRTKDLDIIKYSSVSHTFALNHMFTHTVVFWVSPTYCPYIVFALFCSQ